MGLLQQKFTGIVLGILVIEDLVAVVMMVVLSTLAVWHLQYRGNACQPPEDEHRLRQHLCRHIGCLLHRLYEIEHVLGPLVFRLQLCQINEITPVIGVYDKFAINWAYRWLDVKDPHEELPVLNQWITKHSGDRMYWYGEQQDPKDPIDPRSQDEDLGDDVIKANRYGIQNLKRIVPNIVAWTEAEGRGYLEAGNY